MNSGEIICGTPSEVKEGEKSITDLTCDVMLTVESSSSSETEKIYALLQVIFLLAARCKNGGDEHFYSFVTDAFSECALWSEQFTDWENRTKFCH